MEGDIQPPPILDLTVELGMVRMPALVGESDDELYRPRICMWVDHESGMILHFDLSKADDTETSLIGTSLDNLAARLRGLPKQILTRSPRISRLFKEPLQTIGIDVVVRESLPRADEAIASMAQTNLYGGRAEPSLMKVPGMTLDHVIAFAEAAKLFYDARPWQFLWDDDLIDIETPKGPKGTRFTQVLGAAGQTMGLGFVADRAAHERMQSGGGLAKGVGHWNLLYMRLDELAYDDGELWEYHNLPVADDLAYPRFSRYTASGGPRQPKPEELIWAEGLLRALAASTEVDFDSGRWEKKVETFDGPVVYRFSMPILLEQLQATESKSSATSMESPQVMMERMLRGMEQEVARLGREPTPGDIQKITRDINSGKIDPTFIPQTSAEKAQELCYKARSARGKRIVQLAGQALAIDPNCCDALLIQAERLSADQPKLPLLQQAVRAGEQQLGQQFFKSNAGHFWGLIETRPYMRARAALALELLGDDQLDSGIMHLRKLLELNPNDNQGNRYLLAQAYLSANRLDELDALLNKSSYHDEFSPEWEYTRTLLAYRRHGDTPAARRQLAQALKENPMVAQFLSRRGVPREGSHGGSPPLEIQNAMDVARMIAPSWEEAEGALEWLKSMTGTVAKTAKKKKR